MNYLTRYCFGRLTPQDTPPMATKKEAVNKTDLRLYSDGRFDFLMVDTPGDSSLPEVKQRIARSSGLSEFADPKSSPLLRIFKKEPTEEHRIRPLSGGQRLVMTLEIKNDPALREEYINVHRPDRMWPQVLANMDTMGVQDMELYLMGYQAFLVTAVAADFDMEREGPWWSELPREREWQAHVAQFQRVDAQSNAAEKWKSLKQIL